MTLTFTTSNPGFMCDTSDRNQEVIARLEGERRFIGFNGDETPIYRIYIDGTLEYTIGFDIPIWLAGEIVKQRQQPCVVYSVDGNDSYNAVLHLFQEDENYYTHEDAKWKLRGFITLPDEIVSMKQLDDSCREIPEEECYEARH